MGNVCRKNKEADPDSAWRAQNEEVERNPIYRFADLNKGGKLIEAYRKGGVPAVQEIARKEIQPFLYNAGKGKTITKVEYIKWHHRLACKRAGSVYADTRLDEQILSEYQEDAFNKIETHEACWDLDKRGGVGETALHLLYLADSAEHAEVAKILINMYPKLALDFYEDDEYFGESSLHLATVHGDLESVKLLVSNGANVNQRATGRFFLPEDQKKGKTYSTNYDGFAYDGEYPLAFAACFGHVDIYDYLIDHGADPNMQDSFGNTALHMVVIADQKDMYTYMVKHHRRPARTDITNKANLSPLTLASKLGRHHIFKEILELASIEFWRYSNVTCSAYPLTNLDSIGPGGDTSKVKHISCVFLFDIFKLTLSHNATINHVDWNSALMIVIDGETDEHLEMLEGGVMRQLLDEKWKTFARRRFFQRLVIAFLHLALISVVVYLRKSSDLLVYAEAEDAVRFTAEILVCLFCVGILVMEVVEIGSQGFIGFLKNCMHAPAQSVFMVSCLCILLCIPFRFLNHTYVEDVLLILAVPGCWFFLLFFARSVKLTGPFVTMIYKMCAGDLFRFGMIYIIFLVGFTQGFYFLFRDINQDRFDTLPNTILTLFQMTLGEFKYTDFDLTRYALLTKLVFAAFMILVPILLLNMLIAMMGNTYQQVISKSEKEWRKQWAKIVVVLERGFSKKQLLKFQREYSVKMAGPANNEDDTKREELRALVVIKTSPKTKAKIRKTAIVNWKKLGREIIRQSKLQKKTGDSGPFKLRPVDKKPGEGGGGDSDSDDEFKFSSVTAQLAWEKDIDLTKGTAFIQDPGVIENISPRTALQNNISADGEIRRDSASLIPNGKPRMIRKYVKKPNGTPKTSPKLGKQMSFINKIYPLTVATEEQSHAFDLDISKDAESSVRNASLIQETQKNKVSDLEYKSVLEATANDVNNSTQANRQYTRVHHSHENQVSHDSELSLREIANLGQFTTRTNDSVSFLETESPIHRSGDSLVDHGSPHRRSKKKKRKHEKKKHREKSTEREHRSKERKERVNPSSSTDNLLEHVSVGVHESEL